MRTNVTFWVVVAVLLAAAAALWITMSTVELQRPTRDEMRVALLADLQRLAGPDAKACGLVQLDRSDDAPLQCAEEEMAHSHKFWVAAQLQSDDSDAWSVVVGRGGNIYLRVILDSSPHGEPQRRAEYVATLVPCDVPSFSIAANVPVDCRALARL